MQSCCSDAGSLNDSQRGFHGNSATRPDLISSGCLDAPPVYCQGCSDAALLSDSQLCMGGQCIHICYSAMEHSLTMIDVLSHSFIDMCGNH